MPFWAKIAQNGIVSCLSRLGGSRASPHANFHVGYCHDYLNQPSFLLNPFLAIFAQNAVLAL